MASPSIRSDIFRLKSLRKGAIIIAIKTIVFTIAAAKEFDALPS